ncbi:MAG TPA: hypothetical protein VJ011_07160 [Steroidobacteraceae bacterium]|nr:hypothetical protein [Steroidobacteraceae bacterium]
MQPARQAEPPRILQIYRDFLEPGADAAYRDIEEEAARICARLRCPNPYLAIESLTGPKEVWYLNGYRSAAHVTAVAEAYRNNAPLMAALDEIPRRKAELIRTPLDVLAEYRDDLTRGGAWQLGQGRFLVIAVCRGSHDAAGTVFEARDRTLFIVASAQSRAEANAKARAAGSEARVFAVRPSMSVPAEEWVVRDPDFWYSKAR